MSHAIVGLFNSTGEASAAQQKLVAAGIPLQDIKVSGPEVGSQRSSSSAPGYEDKGFWSSLKEMFGAGDEADADRHMSYYEEGTRRGGVVMTVDAPDAQSDEVATILTSAGAVDIDAKASEWRESGWTGAAAAQGTATHQATATHATDDAAAQAQGKIDLVKEEIQVGKRVVDRGGVRIVKRVIERPVEQDVKLREERVSVDRRAVDRPLQGAEATDAFKEQTFEMTESAEEAVAAKTARVVGEVVVGKTVNERTEKVRDTVRETDVQVEQLPGKSTSATTKVVEDTGNRSEASRSAKTGA